MKFDEKFTLSNAFILSELALLAYEKEEDCRDRLLFDFQFTEFEFLRGLNGTELFVASDSSSFVVSFRGTELKIEDWLTDLDLDLIEAIFFPGRVHNGFIDAFSSVSKDIVNLFYDWKGNKKQVFFTGHSLGASLATLGTAFFINRKMNVDGLYTFGSPRVGDEEFSEWFNSIQKEKAYRFVNNNDIVTRIPPRSLGYSHVGTLKYFKEDGELQYNISCWERFLDRLKGRSKDILDWGTDGIKDHSMKTYFDLLGNYQ